MGTESSDTEIDRVADAATWIFERCNSQEIGAPLEAKQLHAASL